jgi:hypothetical protein
VILKLPAGKFIKTSVPSYLNHLQVVVVYGENDGSAQEIKSSWKKW